MTVLPALKLARSLVRPAVVALVAGTALGLAPTPAHAEGSNIFFERKDEPTRTVYFRFGPTDPALKINPGSVKISADGKQLPKEAFQAKSADEVIKPGRQIAMLVIDTSGSMRGRKLIQAKQAALNFLDTVPNEVEVGMITFATDVTVALPPTTDRAKAENAVRKLIAKGQTALYDAVAKAAQEVGRTGSRSILLLSDGEHAGTPTTLTAAVKAVEQAGDVRLDAVAFQVDEPVARDALDKLTRTGKGKLFAAGSGTELAQNFETVARLYEGQVSVSLQVPPELADGEVTVDVSGVASGEQVDEQVSASKRFIIGRPLAAPAQQVDTGPRAVAIDPGPWSKSIVPYVALILVFASVSVVVGFAFNAFQPLGQRGRISRRLAIYTLGGRPRPVAVAKEATVFGQGTVMQGAVELAGRLVAQRRMEVGLRRRLDAAGLPLKPPEWVLVQVAATLAVPVVLGALTGSIALALLGLLIGAAGPILFLRIAESRRQQRFVDQLPDTLQLISGSLSTGYSLPQALDSVVQEGTEPVAGEFNKALVDHRLGRPIDDALRAIAVRMNSEEWQWVVMAIRIQREVGGNLAELLSTVADTLRDRARMHRQVRALSAEGRLSAYILMALPIVFAIYLLVARPSYIGVLFTDPMGMLGLGLSVGLLVLGAFWLRRIVKVEV
jgi:tight adherence protein B